MICIYGDDDPYIPQEVLHNFAVETNAREIVIEKGGHLNKVAGYETFEEILKYI